MNLAMISITIVALGLLWSLRTMVRTNRLLNAEILILSAQIRTLRSTQFRIKGNKPSDLNFPSQVPLT